MGERGHGAPGSVLGGAGPAPRAPEQPEVVTPRELGLSLRPQGRAGPRAGMDPCAEPRWQDWKNTCCCWVGFDCKSWQTKDEESVCFWAEAEVSSGLRSRRVRRLCRQGKAGLPSL